MLFIDTRSFEPPEDWQKQSEEYTQALKDADTKEDRDAFIDQHNRHWSAIKPKLLALSYNKCWYSEAREKYSYYHVEHFRPKKKSINLDPNLNHEGYWWLCFDWKNYRICGSVGNAKKGNHFAVKKGLAIIPDDDLNDEMYYLLDPTSPDDVKLVTFNENGEMTPSRLKERALWSYERAKYTIDILNLNFDRLKEERKRLWGEMVDLISDISHLIIQQENAQSASKKAEIKKLKEIVRHKIAPCSEFSTTYRACLRASREDWALEILMEPLDPKIYCKHHLDEPSVS